MNEDNNLEKLKKGLYEREGSFLRRGERDTLRPRDESAVLENWQRLRDQNSEKKRKKKPMKVFVYILIFFLMGLLGFVFYLWFSGVNVISSENVFMDVNGPIYVDGGQASNFNFTVKNNNTAPLELADLIFNFPDNSFSLDGKEITRQRITLGDIRAGETISKTLGIVFFGLENEEKSIGATLEYRIAGSNAIFAKNKNHIVKITKSPIGLSLSIPKEVASNQEVSIKVDVVSNSESAARKLRLEMKYP
ncbi:MAG: hypothetical protein AAB890_03285, partial [Patescibacteria group bacterium]